MPTAAVVRPDMINKDSPVTFERKTDSEPQEIARTVKRSILVHATLDAEKEKQNILDDFRSEKIS